MSVPISVKGRIIVEILEAMVYLTERHIIHKDIKPENILVDKEFHIKVRFTLPIPPACTNSHVRSSIFAFVFPRLQTWAWPSARPGANSPRRSLGGRVAKGNQLW